MLEERVVTAVQNGKFNVYAVRTVDDALIILLKKSAGKRNKNGIYPKGSTNYYVLNRLKHMAEMNKDSSND